MKRNLVGSLCFVLVACGTAHKTSTAQFPAFDAQGHRGCRGLMPENTVPAMLKAIDLGVTTLELDVVISRDRKVVVSHDVYFSDNITTTPEGSFLTKAEAAKRLLYTMDYDSIRKYDVGLKPHPGFPRQQKIAVVKPLLTDLIRASEAHAKKAGRTILYNIEVKSSPENDGKKHPPVAEFVSLVMGVIKAEGIAQRTTVQSFDPRALRELHRMDPGQTSSLLMEGTDKRTLDEQLNELGFVPKVYSPHFSLVTASLIEQCRKKKMVVIPWTANTLDEMKRLKGLGVNGIITDYPDLFAGLD